MDPLKKREMLEALSDRMAMDAIKERAEERRKEWEKTHVLKDEKWRKEQKKKRRGR